MPDQSISPNWFHALRLLMAFLLTAAMGIHSYYRHVQESVKVVSARKLMYWLYSVVFLFACTTNFVLLVLTLASKNYGDMPPHIGVFTLLLVFSYLALLAGARKSPYK
ncbi:MAG: hypothetical protein ACYC64_17815 [Armatimonadota bacterium]